MGRVIGSTNLFKGSDLQRAVRSARAAGLTIARVEIDKAGKIAVVAGPPAAASGGDANPWDAALASSIPTPRGVLPIMPRTKRPA